ncbi:MAG TPA: choice-of-anchor tandem repeat GloVer-containing protein [Candidatus Sulfotelmatobacter sp.]|nr:choice-of-anchor tandem repeat GloVer-containing protein [Candidatus Sulfotelmatobacter sp.]
MKRIGILLLAAVCSLAPTAAAQATVETLLQFNGTESEGNLVFDSAGNLYGTTGDQYSPSLITVFQLTPNTDGTWTENVLWTSTGGNEPLNIRAGVIFDASGNLYGTSRLGGAYGCGTVFELTHQTSGSWPETNLVDFDCAGSGAYPIGGVTFDQAGNLYGTTSEGGSLGDGLIYELTPSSGGTWTENILHNFTGGSDGAYPDHPFLIFDSSGNLYGSAALGGQGNCPLFGSSECGTIFKLTPLAGGTWDFTVLHAFTGGSDGGNPEGTLVFDTSGNLYGTTYGGGTYDFGVAFKLIPHTNGKWGERVLHAFKGGDDGTNPLGGVIFDAAGNLYGTTAYGGKNQCFNAPGCGVVYELEPKSSGTGYTEEILVHFHGAPNDGPYNDLVMDSLGNLYGTATGYNTYASGTVYEVVR